MNERSFIVKSLSAIPQRLKQATSRLSFKILYLATIRPDDATRVGPDMALTSVHQSGADWAAQQIARSK